NSPDAGPWKGRYVAAVFSGVTYMILGAIAGTVVALIGALPSELATILLGMVLVKVVVDEIKQAWGAGTFTISEFFAFIIALSGISFFGITAPFWSLLGGAIVSLAFEFTDYRTLWFEHRSKDIASKKSVPVQ